MVVWAGDGSPSKRDRQPLSFFLSYAVAREASAAPVARGNKKAQPYHTRVDMGQVRLHLQ